MEEVIGIDLGTINSCVAVMQGGRPAVIPGPDGSRVTPSAIHFCSDGTVQTGNAELKFQLLDPANTIVGIKRFIGRRFNEVVDLARNTAFKVLPGKNNLALVEIHGRHYSPQEISAYLLRSLKDAAAVFLGESSSARLVAACAMLCVSGCEIADRNGS